MNTRLMPGKFVRLKGQPHDLPDFVLERYLGKFCWIRQQAWGKCVQWKVEATRIETELTASGTEPIYAPISRLPLHLSPLH